MTVCAVDIGGTWTKVALVDESCNVQHFHRIPTAPPLEQYSQLLFRKIEQVRSNTSAARGIGVSLAGFIDEAHSKLIYNPNLPWLENHTLRSELTEAFGLPVTIEVDSNAAALGEYRFGNGADSKRFLCLTVGTGIGGGLVINGKVIRITHECIGDVGHVIVQPGGRRCTCGGLGCAEAVATAPAILAASLSRATSLEHLPNTEETEILFQQAGRYLGLLAASLASIFFPDVIALGGGVCEASPLVLVSAQEEFTRSSSDFARRSTRIVGARLGARAALIGAAVGVIMA